MAKGRTNIIVVDTTNLALGGGLPKPRADTLAQLHVELPAVETLFGFTLRAVLAGPWLDAGARAVRRYESAAVLARVGEQRAGARGPVGLPLAV